MNTDTHFPADILTDEDREWIDNADYITMLRRWRTAPAGDSIFCGITGRYFMDVIKRKKAELTEVEQVVASKHVGWDANG